MQILFLAHRIPFPPNKGDKIRSFHQIKYLSKRHTLHLACMVDEKEDMEHVKTLEKYCASVSVVYRDKTFAKLLACHSLFTDKPISVVSFYSKELAKMIDQKLKTERFDAIFVFSSAMAEYVKHVSTIRKVMDFIDVDSDKWRLYADYHSFPMSWIYRMEASRLSRYEEEVARTFDHSIFVSEKEAIIFRQRVKNRSISVIPNGVDLDYFHYDTKTTLRNDNPVIVFIGAMDYFPNVDAVKYFCNRVFPLIRKVLPEARFYIVGRNPTRSVRDLGRHQNVTVTGSVADVRPYLVKAKVVVAPFRIARGVQNKVLEAMAMGVPVVGTSCAFQGTQATPMDGIRIVDNPEAMSQEVVTLIQDSKLWYQCSLQAGQYVERNHRWDDHGTSLESFLYKVTETFYNRQSQTIVTVK